MEIHQLKLEWKILKEINNSSNNTNVTVIPIVIGAVETF